MKKFLNTIAAAGAVLLGAVSMSAHAGLVMMIDDLSTVGIDYISPTISNDSPLAGPIVFSSANWAFSATTGVGNGLSSVFGIDLNSIAASSNLGGTLRISLTQTDLNFGADGGPLNVFAGIGGTTQGSISYSAWVDDANAAFGHGQQIFSGLSSGVFSDSGGVITTASDPFSLTLQVEINHVGKKLTSFDFGAGVPEPSSLALISVTLLGAGFAARRRNKA